MSFTSEIKKEICKEEIDAQMMKAQLCALFQMRASLHMNWQGMYLSFQTENATIAKHVFQIMKTLYDTGFDGVIRPDHGRMIWDEVAMPGYGLYDRALGAAYLTGLWEAIDKSAAMQD